MKTTKAFLPALLFFLISTHHAFAQEFDKKQISIQKQNDKIYILSFEGDNSILFLGKDGNTIVTNGHSPLSEGFFEKIKEKSDKPIKFIIYTHIHSGSLNNNYFPQQINPSIIFQENAFKRLSGKVEDQFSLITFDNKLVIKIDDEEIFLMHYSNAHTDGDTVIYFKNSDILFTGNIFYPGSFPFIDIKSGGTIKGYLDAVNNMVNLSGKKTVIVPGSSFLTNKKELEKFQKMFKNSKNRIELMVHAGKSLNDILGDKPLDDFSKDWDSETINSGDFTKNLFDGLSNKK